MAHFKRKLRGYRLIATLAAAMTSAQGAVPSCENTIQASPQQPLLVQNPDQKLDVSMQPADLAKYTERAALLKTSPRYHDIVLHPRATLDSVIGDSPHENLSLTTPIILVGLEKPRGKTFAHVDHSCHGRDFDLKRLGAEYQNENLRAKVVSTVCDVLNDDRSQLLTHIAWIDGVEAGRYGQSHFVYNAYAPESQSAAPLRTSNDKEDLYASGLSALKDLQLEIHRSLSEHKVTDLVVLSTGWNTTQRETLYNTLDWMEYIGKARVASNPKRPYLPLYVTISWQSEWHNSLLKMLPTDVVTKGNDADELGLTWVNRLVNDVVLPEAVAAGNLPVTLIGHSYGTRVLSSAIYLRGIIDRPAGADVPPTAFVAFEAAFPINRYGVGKGKEPWFSGVDPHALVVITSSRYDSATSLLKWGSYVGGDEVGARIRHESDGNLAVFGGEVLKADENGNVPIEALTIDKPHVVDASAFVSCEMPGTGGGAHSDVFDETAGHLIGEAMDATWARSQH
jgi:hypothetical protein